MLMMPYKLLGWGDLPWAPSFPTGGLEVSTSAELALLRSAGD